MPVGEKGYCRRGKVSRLTIILLPNGAVDMQAGKGYDKEKSYCIQPSYRQ